MLTFYAPQQAEHAPLRELNNGEWVEFSEKPARLDAILSTLGGEIRQPDDLGLAPIEAVHSSEYLSFLKCAFQDWCDAGRKGDAIGYAFPVVRRRAMAPERIDAKLGLFGFDAATPIAGGTWDAAYWSAQSALNAVATVVSGSVRQTFSLCRPPGHHAGPDYYGGYCYLNNAAIAAKAAQAAGMSRVAILDVDYHHGNGTQDIFYADGSVFFASIHADPLMDYPYFWGHGDETGEAGGSEATLNFPLARGTQWNAYGQALDHALQAIKQFDADALIISYGADTFADDPISFFDLQTNDMERMGKMISTLGLPTITVMEGGYDIAALGTNVSAFLNGLTSS